MYTNLSFKGYNFQIYNYDYDQLIVTDQGQGMFAPFVRFGDYQSTGFPSAFVTLVNESSTTTATSYLLSNDGCNIDEICSGVKVSNARMLTL